MNSLGVDRTYDYGDYHYEFGAELCDDDKGCLYAKTEHNGKTQMFEEGFESFEKAVDMFTKLSEVNIMVLIANKLTQYVHEDQVDKGGNPYYLHPITVGQRFTDPIRRVVGYLHDVIEDTEFPMQILKDMFPPIITDALDAISRRKEPRKETDEEYFARIIQNEIATDVKLQDLLHNLVFFRQNKLEPTFADVDLLIKYANQVKYLLEVKASKNKTC